MRLFVILAMLCVGFVRFGKSLSMKGTAKISSTTPTKNVILYDGVCNFCNSWVDLLLKLDTKKQFRYSALQSPSGMELLEKIGKDRKDLSSVVFIKELDLQDNNNSKYFFKSDAALQVMQQLGLPPFTVKILTALLPKPIRDGIYDGVATNRYRILGKRDECRCSDPNYSDRFI